MTKFKQAKLQSKKDRAFEISGKLTKQLKKMFPEADLRTHSGWDYVLQRVTEMYGAEVAKVVSIFSAHKQKEDYSMYDEEAAEMLESLDGLIDFAESLKF